MSFKVPVVCSVRLTLLFAILLVCRPNIYSQKDSLDIRKIFKPAGPICLQVLIKSAKDSGFGIHYDKGTLNPMHIIDGKAELISLNEMKDRYLLSKKTYAFYFKGTLHIRLKLPGQHTTPPSTDPTHTLTVSVTVKNEKGETLSGAYLWLKYSKQLILTNEHGTAVIHTNRLRDTLYCFHVGYDTGTVVLTISGTAEIKMATYNTLKEAFVTAPYRTGPKSTSTGDLTRIDRKQLEHQSVSDPLAALAGQVPGLRITQSSGVPGGSFRVSLRGKMSILNAGDPLYIIDGVPYSPGGQSVSYAERGNSAGSLSPFSFLSLDDIDNMEVLKDADATSIYGAKGANGVILITTRYGIAAKRRVNISLAAGTQQETRKLDLMNTPQYLAMRREAFFNDGTTPDSISAPDLVLWDTTRFTDWRKWLIGSMGHTVRGRLSFSGGNSTTSYHLSVSNLWETNIFRTNPTHDLLTLNGNLNYRSKDDRLNLRIFGILGLDKNNQFITDLTSLQALAPNAPGLQHKDGSLVFRPDGANMNNPLSSIGQTYEARSHNYLMSGNFQYRVVDSLTAHLVIGFNDVRVNEFSQIPIWTQDPDAEPGSYPTGSSFYANNHFKSWIIEPQLEYPVTRRQWKIRFMAGSSLQGQQTTVKTTSAEGFTNDSWLRQLDKAKSITPDSQAADYRYTAFFGRVNINLRSKYVLNITAREDGSSRFSSGKRYGTFGAAGAAWIFSRENFFNRLSQIVSLGKIKASYGITGNDLIGGGNRYLDRWAPTSSTLFQNIPGANFSGPISPDVTWETIKKLEISMDWNFLNDRFLFTAAWYRHRSDHQLLPDSFPLTGLLITLHNRPAVLQNTGWEFSLVSKNIDAKDFSWTTSANASFPVNRLIALPGTANLPIARELIVGESLNAFRGLVSTGVDKQKGLYTFKDLNGDGLITNADRTVIGKLDVICFGGIENTFHYRQWQLQAFLEWIKQTGTNYQATFYTDNPPGSTFSGLYSNETTDMLNRWRRAGDKATYQKLTRDEKSVAWKNISHYTGSDAMLTDASFVRLKTASLSWIFPVSLLKKMNLQEGKLSLEAQNFFTVTRYKGPDPENQSIMALPPLKTVVLHLQVSL